MARHWFGGTANDMVVRKWNFGQGNNLLALAAGQEVTVWDSETGGTRLLDLLVNGIPAIILTTDEDGYLPRFQGPDGVQTVWLDTGDGMARRLSVTTDAAIDLSSQLATKINTSEKGAASGVAELDADSKIPVAQIPDLSATYAPKSKADVYLSAIVPPSGDPTSAINAGLADAATRNRRFVVDEAASVTGQIVIPAGSRVVCDPTATITSTYTTVGDTGAVEVTGDDVEIVGLSLAAGSSAKFGIFVGDGRARVRLAHIDGTGGSSHFLAFHSAIDCRVEDIHLRSVVSGIRIRGACVGITVRDVDLEQWLTYGVEIRGVSGTGAPKRVVVSGGRATNATAGDPAVVAAARQAVAMFGASDAISENVVIEDWICIGSAEAHADGLNNQGTGDQIGMQWVNGFVLSRIISRDGGENGISVSRNCSNGQVTDITVTGNDGHGLQIGRLTNPSDNIVVANVVANDNGEDRNALGTSTAGVYVQDADNVVLTNIIATDTRAGGSKTQEYGLYLTQARTVTVGERLIDGNKTMGAYVPVAGASTVKWTGRRQATATADQTTTTATLADDTALTAPVDGSAVYEVEATFYYTSTTAVDFQIGWSAPGSATMIWHASGPAAAASSATASQMIVRSRAVGDTETVGAVTGQAMVCTVRGTLTTVGTAGSLVARIAQGTLDAGVTTTRQAGSTLTLTRIA